MVAEVVDAVIGVDTHSDNHEVEIADPRGTPIATMRISNDSAGFTQLLAAVAEVAPGPRLAVSMEGSRSYGIGLARALTAAGLPVIECEQPARKQRRGKGKSDRSIMEFIRGVRTPLRTTVIPASARIASNSAGCLPSRSRIRYRAFDPASCRSMTRLRAACVTHAVLG
jgi:transposase